MASYSKTLTDDLGVADRHTWSEMIYSWDTYTGTWDSYGDIPVTKILTAIRSFIETITNTESFSRIAVAHRTLIDSISHSETLLIKYIKTFTETINHSEVLSRILTAIRTLTDEITHTDSVIQSITKNLTEAMTLTASLTKSTIKNIANAISMTERFANIRYYVRTLTETLNVSETDWTWDMMTSTWDDYTENWNYYSKSFSIIKILVRSVSDGIEMTENILVRSMSMIKGLAMKRVEASPFGIIKTEKMTGKISAGNSFGKISSQDLTGKIEKENLFGKISNS
jgi:hypothetical protein